MAGISTAEIVLLAVCAAAALLVLVLAVRNDLKGRPDLKLLQFPTAPSAEGADDGAQ